MSTTEVAKRLGLSSEWVRREILAGRLGAQVLKRGARRRIYRVSETQLTAYLQRYGRGTGGR